MIRAKASVEAPNLLRLGQRAIGGGSRGSDGRHRVHRRRRGRRESSLSLIDLLDGILRRFELQVRLNARTGLTRLLPVLLVPNCAKLAPKAPRRSTYAIVALDRTRNLRLGIILLLTLALAVESLL